MKRANYRVLSYYKNNEYSKECYISIINAKSEYEVTHYFGCTDLDFEIINEMEVFTIDDVKKADSVMIDGERIYADDKAYESAVNVIARVYDLA